MLVLTRNKGQSVTIDGGVIVHVLRMEGGKVKLGFEAPTHIGIRRTECREWHPESAEACCDVETAELEYVDALPDGKSAGVACSVAGVSE